MTFDEVRRIALALPGVVEGTYNGMTAFHVRRRLFARLREDGDSLVLKCNIYERRYLMEDLPDVFFLRDHYHEHPYVLVRLATVAPEMLREQMEAAWRLAAPKTLAAQLDARQGG